ncbi:MAG: BsaWI family type II restriction enzyme [Aquificaceae bacterium]
MKDSKKVFLKALKLKAIEDVKLKGIENLSNILETIRQEFSGEITKFGIKDAEQSWKAFKGRLLEELIVEVISSEVKKHGLNIISGSKLSGIVLDECLCMVKRSILVDYGEFGMHVPDADLVIYNKNCRALAIISVKATLRERIAQTGYWSLKLKQSKLTQNIKVFFITLDEDKDLTRKRFAKKGRAIVEVDTDGAFVITTERIEESEKVMPFEKFRRIIEKLGRVDKDE